MVKCIILLITAVMLPTVPLYADSQPRQLSEAELAKLRSSVQKSKANAKVEAERVRQEEERLRQALAEEEAEAARIRVQQQRAVSQMRADVMNTFNNEMKKNQAIQAAFDARLANTIQVAQQQKQKEEQARQAQQQRQREIQARQTQNAQSNIASPQTQTAQSRDQALRETAVAERQRLQQEQQRKQEAEQRQLALVKKQKEEKRQKELDRQRQEELKKAEEELKKAEEVRKKQELVDYNRAIRAGTRVGAISCHGGQSTRIVGVLGKAQRPKHVYTNCSLQEVRYRCPSESNWQHTSRRGWLLNNACIGVGDDVTVNVNCPAEQLIVQATHFSCDIK